QRRPGAAHRLQLGSAQLSSASLCSQLLTRPIALAPFALQTRASAATRSFARMSTSLHWPHGPWSSSHDAMPLAWFANLNVDLKRLLVQCWWKQAPAVEFIHLTPSDRPWKEMTDAAKLHQDSVGDIEIRVICTPSWFQSTLPQLSDSTRLAILELHQQQLLGSIDFDSFQELQQPEASGELLSQILISRTDGRGEVNRVMIEGDDGSSSKVTLVPYRLTEDGASVELRGEYACEYRGASKEAIDEARPMMAKIAH
ncbi:MAG: hypothetical protein P4L40_01975, partial [Terracidiphilus sp.]|nr:hypothetical protein [Terracidiphilus sp.]